MSTRSKLGREDIKWQELLSHFRLVQGRHEKARRQAMGGDVSSFSDFGDSEKTSDAGHSVGPPASTTAPGRPPVRRKVTGDFTPGIPRLGVLSPLNPRARVQAGPLPSTAGPPVPSGRPGSPNAMNQPSKQQRPLPSFGRRA